MNIRTQKEENAMLARVFVRLFPVQAAMIAMSSINSIVDGVVAARFIDTPAVGVIGLYYAIIYVLEASGSVLLGGVTVLSGKQFAVLNGFLSSVIPALLLAPLLGAQGVWLAFLIGLFITLGVSMLYPVLRLKRIPRSLDEWLLLSPEFGFGERLVIHLHKMADMSQTAERVQSFCNTHHLSRRTGSHAGLCLEEIAANIVQFGFQAYRKNHEIETRHFHFYPVIP